MCAQREHAAAQFLLNSMAMPASRGSWPVSVSDVERIIPQLLPHGRAGMSEVARQLGMSSRTLSRKSRVKSQSSNCCQITRCGYAVVPFAKTKCAAEILHG